MLIQFNDPILLGFLLLAFLFIFAVYLLFRRTVLAFREGFEGDR